MEGEFPFMDMSQFPPFEELQPDIPQQPPGLPVPLVLLIVIRS
jgi:hypothetical protein